MSKLAVLVLGNRKSGKSKTWYGLFRRKVRTGTRIRRLILRGFQFPAFLVSGSAEERKTYIGKIIGKGRPRLVLCSLQYRREAVQTIDFFVSKRYALYVQWLNPGYHDAGPVQDSLGLLPYLLHCGATVCIRDASGDPRGRIRDIEEFILGWAANRRL